MGITEFRDIGQIWAEAGKSYQQPGASGLLSIN
jgi:hypothetical protein